ncbi:MAG: DUF3107 domain-containing protein [Propioniciclava sp.]
MEVKVGIRNVAREVALETTATAATLEADLTAALAANGVFALTDDRGRKVLIPAAQIAYVDLGTEHARPVGFGAPNS